MSNVPDINLSNIEKDYPQCVININNMEPKVVYQNSQILELSLSFTLLLLGIYIIILIKKQFQKKKKKKKKIIEQEKQEKAEKSQKQLEIIPSPSNSSYSNEILPDQNVLEQYFIEKIPIQENFVQKNLDIRQQIIYDEKDNQLKKIRQTNLQTIYKLSKSDLKKYEIHKDKIYFPYENNYKTKQFNHLKALKDQPENIKSSQIVHYQSDTFETGRFKQIFTKVELIGKGGFGKVYKAYHKLEKHIYAVKKIRFQIDTKQNIRQHKFFREVSNIQQFDHKNVLKFHTIWIELASDNKKILNREKILKLNEKSQNESTSYSYENGIDYENENKIHLYLFIQVLYHNFRCNTALITLQKPFQKEGLKSMINNVLISSIKFQMGFHTYTLLTLFIETQNNILIDSNNNLVIGDFGLSVENDAFQSPISRSRNIGTPLYRAPEQFLNEQYSNKVDIYSFGLILFELYCVFSNSQEKNQAINLLKDQGQFPQNFDNLPNQKQLIQKMIQEDSQDRPDINQIINCQEFISWKNSLN